MTPVPLFDLKFLTEFAAGGVGTSNRRHSPHHPTPRFCGIRLRNGHVVAAAGEWPVTFALRPSCLRGEPPLASGQTRFYTGEIAACRLDIGGGLDFLEHLQCRPI